MVLTDNVRPLPVEVSDRRFCFFLTPLELIKQPFVHELGGIYNTIQAINEEIADFCQYLRDVVPDIAQDSYHILPDLPDKVRVVKRYYPYPYRLVFFLECQKYAELVDCLLYTSPSPRDRTRSRMPSSA